jgi:hypothetical protein
MTTTIGPSTPYQLTVPALSETADIQVALRLLSYGTSGDPANDAGISSNSLVGYLKTGLALKSNIASPTFTGTVYAPTIQSASSATTGLNISTINQTSNSAGSISITAGNSTSNGSGGSINLTAGSYSASGSPGNINLNAGGGSATGTVNIQTSQYNTGGINLGNSGSTTTVSGALSLGTGISGIVYKAQGTTEGVSSAGTLTWAEVKSLIILSQPSSPINLTLPAASSNSSITTDGYSFDWSIINKSSTNAITVLENTTSGLTNTLDGAGLIPAKTSGRFTTRRISSTSYKTYRIA